MTDLRWHTRRWGKPVIAAVVIFGVFALAAARVDTASANANSCNSSSTNCGYCSPYGYHYYGEACLFGDFSAMKATIESAALNVSDYANDLIINDTWIVNTNNGDPHWVEAGMLRGSICTHGSGNVGNGQFTCDPGAGYTASTNPRLFWADDRSSCECLYSHIDTTDVPSWNTPYDVYIYKLDSQDWVANIGQTFGGTSTSNTLTPNLIRAGTEENPQSATGNLLTSCSKQYNLQYWDSGGTYHNGWSNSTHGNATLESDAPPYAWWINQPYSVGDKSNDPTCYGS